MKTCVHPLKCCLCVYIFVVMREEKNSKIKKFSESCYNNKKKSSQFNQIKQFMVSYRS